MIIKQRPLVAILAAPGTNCHEETAYAVDQAGGQSQIVLVTNLMEGSDELTNYASVIIPGGFSWGDHLAAGRIEGIHLVSCLKDQMKALLARKKPILGICNGFQVLAETGLLPHGTLGKRGLALLQNRSAVFESRIVRLVFKESDCIWTRGLAGQTFAFPIPVAHAEGRLSTREGVRPVCYYVDQSETATEEYAENPNGSPGGIAGITDESGLIFGLMPHPERAVEEWHCSTAGRQIFNNLISFLSES